MPKDVEGATSASSGQPSSQSAGHVHGSDELAVRMSESARELQQQHTADETLQAVVAAAIELVPGAQEGSISVVERRRRVRSEAASSDVARRIDHPQDELGEGPCLSAVYEQETVRLSDTRTEPRWPRFSTKACEAGAGSILSLQLFGEGDDLGALNLCSRERDAFDDESEHVGLLFAAHAAIAFSAAQTESRLRHAVGTREVIGQASASSWSAARSRRTRRSHGSCVPASTRTSSRATSPSAWSPPETSDRPRTRRGLRLRSPALVRFRSLWAIA